MRSFFVLLLCLFYLMPTADFYLHSSPVQGHVLSDKLKEEPVSLNVMVLSKKTEEFVGNLQAENFLIQEDGKTQTITRFLQDTRPLSILLLVDMSGSMRPHSQQIIETLRSKGMTGFKPDDEVALMNFTDKLNLIQDFTRDKTLLGEKIRTLHDSDAHGSMSVIDAIFEASAYMKKTVAAEVKRVLIVITDDKKQIIHSEPKADTQRDFLA